MKTEKEIEAKSKEWGGAGRPFGNERKYIQPKMLYGRCQVDAGRKQSEGYVY